MELEARLARRMDVVQPNAIGELLRLGAEPGITSFGGGYPDDALFPLADIEDVLTTAIREHGRAALQYSVPAGLSRLREQIAARMALDGVDCAADEVLVLQGAQQGLDLVAKLLLDPGDLVITENPTFLGALIAFDPCEPRYAAVRIDDGGIVIDDLARTLAENPGAKLLYTVPDFQNPTGVTLAAERRPQVLELARAHDLVILEDTPYRALRFAGTPAPTLKSLDVDGRVIHLGSFSKVLAPGLRIGWAVASRAIIERLALLKLAADTQCSTLNMHAVSLFLDRHDVDAHVATLRAAYQRKRDVMLDAIETSFPRDVRSTEPEGGLFTWLTFPDGFDTAAFMRERALPEARVAYVPGATFFPTAPEHNHARVNYSCQPEEAIVRGIGALGRLLGGPRSARTPR